MHANETDPHFDRDRRRFPRTSSIVHFRRPRTMPATVPSSDLSIGGMRVNWNDPVHVDELLELEVFLGDGCTIVCSARVAWVQELPLASPTRYEVGIEFLDLSEEALDRLSLVLEADSPAHVPAPRDLASFEIGPRVRAPHSAAGSALRSIGLSRIADLFRIS